MKRTTEVDPIHGYEGQKIQKTSELLSPSTVEKNSLRTCFPIELGILNEICSFSTLSAQCSLYSVCKSIRDIMDGDNFIFNHQSRKIIMLMKDACGEFNSEVDRRNFFIGICYRLNAELAILENEITNNRTIERNLSSLFCLNTINTGNSSFYSVVKKFPTMIDSNKFIFINLNYATFQSSSTLISKFVISCNGRVLINYEKEGTEEIDMDKRGLDSVLKLSAYGMRGNIQQFIKEFIPKTMLNGDQIYQSLMKAYESDTGGTRADKFGWCSNFSSKKGIIFASNLIDKMCKITKKSTLLILMFTHSASSNFSSTRIAKPLQAPTPAFKNIVWCSPFNVSRIYNDESCYEKVEFVVKVRGSLEEKHQFFFLKYVCEIYTGDDDFIDVRLECYFNPKDPFYLYQKCTEMSRFEEPTSCSTEYLSKIEKILGKGVDDPTNIVKLMSKYAMTNKRKLFNIHDYFIEGGEESGANKKPFKFTNGIEEAEELETEDIFDFF